MSLISKSLLAVLVLSSYISTSQAALPDPGMDIVKGRTAVLVTDPQNDFLSPDGATWGVVGKNVTANNTVENIESLFKPAKKNGIPVFISPHYYFPHDHGWKFEGALEKLMHNIGMFDRKDLKHDVKKMKLQIYNQTTAPEVSKPLLEQSVKELGMNRKPFK